MIEVIEIACDQIIPDPANVRKERITRDSVAGLMDSIKTIGLVQPIRVRPMPPTEDGVARFMVVVGHRRLAATKWLKHPTIEAIVVYASDADAARAQIAENVVRDRMRTVDVWKAAARLSAEGCKPLMIAHTLGISQRSAQQLECLGRLLPAILDALADVPDHQLPTMRTLGTIASAPFQAQTRAFASAKARGGGSIYNVIADTATALQTFRISQNRAVFDLSQMPWDEDLFAPPGESLTTTDVDRFLELQRAALAEQCAADQSAYSRVMVEFESKASELGDVVQFHSNERVPLGTDKIEVSWVVPSGPATGMIRNVIVRRRAPASDGDAESLDGATTTPEPEAPQRFTAAGLALIAAHRETAIVAALGKTFDPWMLLTGLLMAIGGDNVSVTGTQAYRGQHADSRMGPNRLAEIGNGISHHFHHGDHHIHEAVIDGAREAISRLITAPHPGAKVSTGPLFDDIGILLGARQFLPRMDTPEILEHAKGAVLRDQWLAMGRKGASVAQMREGIAGHAPLWIPEDAEFIREEDK